MAKPKPKSKATRTPASRKTARPAMVPALALGRPHLDAVGLGSFVARNLADAYASWTEPALVDDAAELIRLLAALVRMVTEAERLAPAMGWTREQLRSDSHARVLAAYKGAFGRLPNTLRINATFALLDAAALDVDAAITDALAGDHGLAGYQVARRREDAAAIRELALVWLDGKSGRRPLPSKYKLLATLLARNNVRVTRERLKKMHDAWRKKRAARNRQSAP